MKQTIKWVVMSVLCMALTLTGTNLLGNPAEADSGMAQIGSNLWNISWGGDKAFKLKSQVNWETAYSEGFDVWNSYFIEDIKPYVLLRFMDWELANQDNIVSWSDRKSPTEEHTNSQAEVAYEWMIDLGNRTQKDVWFCVPYKADDDYITQLASLVKEKLDPGLKCYIEYSNETWNYANPKNYCKQKAGELSLPGYNERNDNYKAEIYNIYRSFQIFDIFEAEFGDEMSQRVVKVCAIGGEHNDFRDQMEAAYNALINNTTFNPNAQKADMMAIAPYVGHNLTGSDTNIADQFKSAVDSVYNSVLHGKAIANRLGLRYGTYEGGQHLTRDAAAFSSNPEIYDCYNYMLGKFAPQFEVFVHYANCGSWGSGGAWGAKKVTGQSIDEAHKYRALVDFIDKYHPRPSSAATPTNTPSPTPTEYIGNATPTGGSDENPTVSQEVINVESLEFELNKLNVSVGQERMLSVNVLPENATDKTVTFICSNDAVLSVNGTGVIKGRKAGKAVVTASSVNDVIAQCEVTVNQQVKSVKFAKKTVKIKEGKAKVLKCTVKPASAGKKLKWKSSKKKVATVSSTGKVKAKKKGKTVITAIAENGKKAKCTVRVIKK